MQDDEFEPLSETRNRHLGKQVNEVPDGEQATPTGENARWQTAERASPRRSATATARSQYTLSAAMVVFVIAVIGLYLVTDSRINDLESRLAARLAAVSAAQVPTDDSSQRAAIDEMNDRLNRLQTALDELRAQSEADKVSDASSASSDTNSSDAAPPPAAEAGAGKPAEMGKPVTVSAPVVQDTWFINIASFSKQNSARELQSKLLSLDRKATIEPVNLQGKAVYRLRITGLPDKKTAEAEALRLQKELNLSGFWIAKDAP